MNKRNKLWSKRIIAGIMSALILVTNTGLSAFAAEQNRAVPNGNGYESVADPSTMDVWKNYFSTGEDAANQKLLSTEFAGGVWTDKSVFTAADAASSTELPDAAKSIGADNFLVALSAIASNKEIVGYSTIPTDTVLVLDVSQSMDSANSVPNMVSAANSAISRLLGLNKNNRVGVILYSGNHSFGTSQTSSGTELLPLGRYTPNASGQYLSYSSYRYSNTDPNGTSIATATGLQTGGGQNVRQASKITQGATYIQNGLYKAWQMFEDVTDTVVTTTSGNNVQEGTKRMPIMVLMSDGAPTTGTNSYNAIGTSNSGNGGRSTAGLGFMTQLTAAWVRQKIENKYDNEMKFYTLGLDLSRDSNATAQSVAASVLDPKNSMEGIDNSWTDFLRYGSETVSVPNTTGNSSNNGNKNVTISLANDGITFNADSQNYVDRYFEADSNAELNQAFSDIVQEIIVQSAYYPTLVTEGNHNLDGYVTFEDVLGQFMEVKEIKGLMLGDVLFTGEVLAEMMLNGEFGNASRYTDTGWELVETVSERIGVDEAQAITLLQEAWRAKQLYWESDTKYSNYIGWYEKEDGSFVAHWADSHTEAEEAAEVAKGAKYITKSYGFYGATGANSSIAGTNMMHVVIKVRTDIETGHQDVIYQIPAALIPTITYSITLNADSLEEATEFTLKVNDEEPLRLLFEVGLREGLNAINIKEYMANLKTGQHAHAVEDSNHPDYGKYYFYSNQWGDGTQFEDGNYEDDDFDYTKPHAHNTAESHFHPSLDNERYYYTENTTIYVKDGEDYRPYNSATAPAATGSYYRQRMIFRLKSATGDAAEMVTLYEQISEETLKIEDHLGQNSDNSWYVKKGVVHQVKARELELKEENKTKTLIYSDYPLIDHAENSTDTYDVYFYLGNNGRLTVTPATGIELTKQVDDTLVNTNENYTFEISIDTNQSSYDAVLTRDGAESTLTFQDGKAQVTLKAGETVYITDLPTGTYSIEELVAEDADYKVKSVTVNGTPEVGAVASDSIESMTMQEVVFVNTEAKEGNLVIGKTVTHNFGSDYLIPTDVKFDVAVILKDADGNPLANQPFVTSVGNKTTDSNGVISGLTIGHNETISINGLPAGTQYEVQEILGAKDAYFDQTNTNLSGKIAEDATSTVVLTNAYTPTQYVPTNLSIDVTKSVVGDNQAAMNWGGKTFTFELQMLENGVWVSVKNGNNAVVGTASETNPNFSLQMPQGFLKAAGTYYFRVLETNVDETDNILSDTARYFAIYVTDKDMDGALEIDKIETYNNGAITTLTGEQDIDMNFVNQYTDSDLVVEIPIKKVLTNETGAHVSLNGFEFRLYEGNNDTGKHAFSDAHGDASIRMAYSLSELGLNNYDDEITLNYTLYEVKGNNPRISYQEAGIPIAITLKNVNGTLTLAGLSINGSNAAGVVATVTNTYNLSVDHTISGTKYLDNRSNKAMANNEFEFVLYETDEDFDIQGHTPLSVKNTGSTFSWDRTYTKTGSYYYVIVEGETTSPGVTIDKAEHHVTVTVTTDENGVPTVTQSVLRLGTSISDANEDIFFRNTYKAAPVSEVIGGTKHLIGEKVSKDLERGMFTFTLTENGREIDTAENVAFTGAFAFDQITYTEVGTHIYTVKEVIPDEADRIPGVVYDTSEYTVTVVVTDEGNGQLKASKSIQKVGATGTSAAITFENKYEPKAKADLVIEAEKIMKNRALKDAEFTFNLYEANANFIPKSSQVLFTATNDADGKVAFDFATAQIAFDTVGTFYYLIVEDIPTGEDADENVYYDNTVYQVTVVTFDMGGEIGAHLTYAVNGRAVAADKVDFVNYHFDKVEKDVFEKGKTDISIDGKIVKAGDVLTYEITYENTSSDKRQDVTITDVLPEGVSYVEGSATQKGLVVYTASTRELKWVIGSVEAKEKITVSFDVTVNEDAQEVENTGLVQIGDNLYSTNSVTIYTYDKDVDKAKALIGEELTYTIEYRNHEASKADIVVVDKLAEGLTYVEGSATKGGVYDSQTHTITWRIAGVEAGEGGKLSFKAVINEKAVQVIENVATIQVGNNPEVKTDTTTTEILPPPAEEPIPEKAPQTSDNAMTGMWSALAFGSLAVGAILLIGEKKKEEN